MCCIWIMFINVTCVSPLFLARFFGTVFLAQYQHGANTQKVKANNVASGERRASAERRLVGSGGHM